MSFLFAASKPETLVDRWDRTFVSAKEVCKKFLPCTVIAYRSLIPDDDFDLLSLVAKVAEIAALVFLVVKLAGAVAIQVLTHEWVAFIHPIFWLLPLTPLFFDAIRAVYKICRKEAF